MDYVNDLNKLSYQLTLGASSRFSKIYTFPTENVKGCFNDCDFKDKKCLTSLGSSFQMMDMYLKGTKSVTTFDINSTSIYYFYLLKGFIKSGLSLEEYIELFKSIDRKYIDKTFKKILSNMSGLPKKFWEEVYDCFGFYIFINYDLFHFIDEKENDIYNNSLFFNEESIKYLRNHLSILKPNFINCNITSLNSNIKGKYDFMYLSNIMQYASEIYNCKEKDAFIKYKKLIEELSNHLNKNSEIYCSYLYNYLNDGYFNKKDLNDVFNGDNYSYKLFPSYTYEKENNDAVLIYRK